MEKLPSTSNENNKNLQEINIQEKLAKVLDNSTEKIASELAALKENMENLKDYNENLLEANKIIRDILSNPYTTDFRLVEKSNYLLYQFLSPSYKNESLQKSYAKILALIDLANWTEASPEEIKLWIKEVLTDTNLPYIIKKNFVKWLKEKDFLIWDPLERVKIQNYCEMNFPKYNWETFQVTLDTQDWNLAYTDMFTEERAENLDIKKVIIK